MKTAHNRVLVELLAVVRSVYEQFDTHIVGTDPPKWFAPWFKEKDVPDEDDETASADSDNDTPYEGLRAIVESALDRKTLVQFDVDSISTTREEIEQVKTDREPLYREAATLLESYRKLSNGELTTEQAKAFLGSKLFQPSDDTQSVSTLFELYWIFELLETFENPRRKLFSPSRDDDLVAEWNEDGSRYLLFNDWDGTHDSTEYLTFEIPTHDEFEVTDGDAEKPDDGEDLMLRTGSVLRHRYAIETTTLGRNHNNKTPDIVLLELDASAENLTLERAFIGEVKHTTSSDRIYDGLQQLLGYGGYARVGADVTVNRPSESAYLASDPSVLGSPELELGYFIGHRSEVDGDAPDGIQIRGFGDNPAPPFDA